MFKHGEIIQSHGTGGTPEGFYIWINVSECVTHKTEKLITTDLNQIPPDTTLSCSCEVLLVFTSFALSPWQQISLSSTETVSCDKIREDFSLGKCLLGNNHGKKTVTRTFRKKCRVLIWVATHKLN